MKTKISLLISMIMMIFAMTGCAVVPGVGQGIIGNKGPSNEELIENFVASPFNDIQLRIGEEHMSSEARVYLSSGEGTVYNNNPDVITVTRLGKVTAVAPGTAYVVIRVGDINKVLRYTVYNEGEVIGFDFEAAIRDFAETPINTVQIRVGEKHSHASAVWAQNGDCYSSDTSVATVASNGAVTGVAPGVAYIAFSQMNGAAVQIIKYIVTE